MRCLGESPGIRSIRIDLLAATSIDEICDLLCYSGSASSLQLETPGADGSKYFKPAGSRCAQALCKSLASSINLQ